MATTTAPQLADWLLAHGRNATTTEEVSDLIGVPTEHVRVRLRQPVDRHQLFSPARGLWVPIPAEFRTWGTTPATHFVDHLMRHLDREYYLGWLSAAELHGAAHQRPQVTQIAVNRPIDDRDFGRVRLRFTTRGSVAELPRVQHTVPTGNVWVSTPELTALDLADAPRLGGGISNVATVLSELTEETQFSMSELVRLADHFPVATARRLGYLLELVDAPVELHALRDYVQERTSAGPSVLTPDGPRRGRVDLVWGVRVNSEVEPDP